MAAGDTWQEASRAADLSGEAWSRVPSQEAERLLDERYERRGLLGSGGMGKVYVARDSRLRREVALKVAKDPAQAQRMIREAWITAQLEHPGIVPVYDAGSTESGQLFYTMRLIRGRTLELSLKDCSDLGQRLALLPHFLDACQAVAYAHSLGILHRDLKPANILVGEFGETQVADWGLARPLMDPEGIWEERTMAQGVAKQAVVGTPRYMAPEQARGERLDTRADVWALGMMLVEILSGHPPFEGDSQDSALVKLREGASLELDTLLQSAPEELRAVAIKATGARPLARYASARELAADISLYLRGRRVQAHEYTTGQLLVRLLNAWRAPLLVGTLALGGLALLGVLSSQRITQERDLARKALQTADQNLSIALASQAVEAFQRDARPEAELLAAHALRHGESPAARGVLAAFARARRPQLIERVELPTQCHGVRATFSPDRSQLLCNGQRRLELWSLEPLERLWSTDIDTQAVRWVARDRIIAQDIIAYEIAVLDAHTGEILSALPQPAVSYISSDTRGRLIASDPRGNLYYADLEAIPTQDQNAAYWEQGHPGEPVQVCPHTFPALSWGDAILVQCSEMDFQWYDQDFNPTTTISIPDEIRPISFSRLTKDQLLVGSLKGWLLAVDLHSGEQTLLEGLETGILNIVPIPGITDQVLVTGERGGARMWNTRLNSWQGSLPGSPEHAASGAHPGEVILVTDTMDRWDLPQTATALRVDARHGLASVRVDPQGVYVVAASGGGEALVREAATGRLAGVATGRSLIPSVAKFSTFSTNGEWLFAANMMSGAFIARRGDWESSVPVATIGRRGGPLGSEEFWMARYGHGPVIVRPNRDVIQIDTQADIVEGASNRDASQVAMVSTLGEIWILSAREYAFEHLFDYPNPHSIDLNADVSTLWVSSFRSACRVNRQGQDQICTEVASSILDIALSPDETRLAMSLANGDVWVLDATTLQKQTLLRGHPQRTPSIDWSPDSTYLVSASWDASLRFWDLRYQDMPAEELVQVLEQAWSMTLDDVLGQL